MSKSHIVNVTITNSSSVTLQYDHAWFDSGRVADGNSWPASIPPNSSAVVECYEKDFSIAGCSGWVSYLHNGAPLYFAFSNPIAGSNGIDLGVATSVWDDMEGHYYPVGRAVQVGGAWVTAVISSTAGTTNDATWVVRVCDVSVITPANIELANVAATHAAFPTTGTRQYYQCSDSPTGLTGLVKSHFKGISSFANKLIFTHTNLFSVGQTNGKYIIADKITVGIQGATDSTLDTLHPGWLHPCSSQACGSFMAMGIQADESGPGSEVSEIQILDIRMTQINQPAVLLGAISRPNDGVNGVAMTKESGPDGKYLVAGVNGNKLAVYRSTNPSLITNGTPTAGFESAPVFETDSFPDSGAGLALVTEQTSGAIYLFALNADDMGQNNQLNLYQLDLQSQPPACTLVLTKDMQIPGMSNSVSWLAYHVLMLPPLFGVPLALLLNTMGSAVLNSSFRWGKGLAITSSSNFEVYASDRNDLSISEIPAIGIPEDFSLVVWTSSQSPGTPILHWAGTYVTEAQWWGNYFNFTIGTDETIVMNGSPLRYQYDPASGTLSWSWQVVDGTTAMGRIVFSDGPTAPTFLGTVNPRPQDGPVGFTGSRQPSEVERED